MCRNIKTLFNFEPPATEDEVRASALQFVRKLSGFSKPSQANEAVFAAAVAEVSAAARKLLASLHTHAAPRDREVEAEKARARAESGLLRHKPLWRRKGGAARNPSAGSHGRGYGSGSTFLISSSAASSSGSGGPIADKNWGRQ